MPASDKYQKHKDNLSLITTELTQYFMQVQCLLDLLLNLQLNRLTFAFNPLNLFYLSAIVYDNDKWSSH